MANELEPAKVAELRRLGVKIFLAKPFTTDKLILSLQAMLREKQHMA